MLISFILCALKNHPSAHCNFDIIMKVVKRRLFLLTNNTGPDNMSQMHYNEHGL